MASAPVDLPTDKGSYVLCLQLVKTCAISVGKLGRFDFTAGYYFYVGSAFGPGGIAARCGHHIKKSRNPRWHIDYLRAACQLQQIIFTAHSRHVEHDWTQQLAEIKTFSAPIRGFGSSDCDCNSHLFFCPENKIHVVLQQLQSSTVAVDAVTVVD